MSMPIDVIAFDADDTLWVNEPRFIAVRTRMSAMLAPYASAERIAQLLHDIDVRNIATYGYGRKAFILSMLEAAIEASECRISAEEINDILLEGKRMLTSPIELYEHVPETLRLLADKKTLMLITKGDLFEQEVRIQRSGVIEFFTYIEVVSEKSEETYRNLLKKYQIAPERFLMVGNSLKSDILPVVAIGGRAVYIHCADTWVHEHVEDADHTTFEAIEHIGLLPDLLARFEQEYASENQPQSS
ncbi:haloacid dehalogenase domain protein hydrolase [Candidatus Moduliflexus flocculans]|uniref:Haloacid dehalogenase domain protein hydrolase n=1 Tax=Candidatus Moduliflexus flocculans TaxID=1499966 RepID=A0A081BQR8_9BACT|nr:haloacid dehalogenase domain protein hydrolase [Candidatus Moduliflexus flocculans]